ncbi:hypothetical protein OUZ56_004897 [Daphnia magna]|uniref:Uncharacterized protein n=1 Tax=Daphnia magna TaxID=35525 RepID=A0ABQ9YRJ4_9CRUS|nr:hypothetical protein OUZ56_004897 [Daphnia magna]
MCERVNHDYGIKSDKSTLMPIVQYRPSKLRSSTLNFPERGTCLRVYKTVANKTIHSQVPSRLNFGTDQLWNLPFILDRVIVNGVK